MYVSIRNSSFVTRNSVADGVKGSASHDIQHSVCGHRRSINSVAHVDFGNFLLLFACLEDRQIAVFVAEVDFPVGRKRRSPDGREHVVGPVRLSGCEIHAVQESGEVGYVEKTVGDGSRGNGAADFVVLPDAPGLGDIPALAWIDAVQVADAFSIFRVLSDRQINTAIMKNRSRDDIVERLRPDGVLRIQIEAPELFAGQRFEAIQPAVAARERRPASCRRLRRERGRTIGREGCDLPGELSCQTTLPVFLFTAIKLGALGAGTFSLFSSWPLDVSRNSKSPQIAGDELAILC